MGGFGRRPYAGKKVECVPICAGSSGHAVGAAISRPLSRVTGLTGDVEPCRVSSRSVGAVSSPPRSDRVPIFARHCEPVRTLARQSASLSLVPNRGTDCHGLQAALAMTGWETGARLIATGSGRTGDIGDGRLIAAPMEQAAKHHPARRPLREGQGISNTRSGGNAGRSTIRHDKVYERRSTEARSRREQPGWTGANGQSPGTAWPGPGLPGVGGKPGVANRRSVTKKNTFQRAGGIHKGECPLMPRVTPHALRDGA